MLLSWACVKWGSALDDFIGQCLGESLDSLRVMWGLQRTIMAFFHYGYSNDERNTQICFRVVVHVASWGSMCAPLMRLQL